MFTDTTDLSRPIITPGQRMRALIAGIAAQHRVTPADIVGRLRRHRIARHAVWHALWADEGWRLWRIARRMDRDHSTIAHGIGCHILANDLPSNWMSDRVLKKRSVMTARHAAMKKRETAA